MNHEQAPQLPQQEPSALDIARELAGDQRQKVMNWTEGDGAAAGDLAAYLESRPDGTERTRDDHGRFIGRDDAYKQDIAHDNSLYDSSLAEQQSDTEMSLSDLINDWADAEKHDDKTRANDVQTSILDRVTATSGLSDDHKVALLDRITAQKDAQLNGDVSKSEQSTDEAVSEAPRPTLEEVAAADPAGNGQHRGEDIKVGGKQEYHGKHRRSERSLDAIGEAWVDAERAGDEAAATMHRNELYDRLADGSDNETIAHRMDGMFDRINGRLAMDALTERNEAADEAAEVPVTDETPRGLRARARTIMRNASAWLAARGTMGMQRTSEYLGDEEQGSRRRVVAAVAGTVLLIGAGIALYKGFEGVGHHTATELGNATPTPKGHNTETMSSVAVHASKAAGSAASHAHETVKDVHLAAGGTIWEEAKRQLVRDGVTHPTGGQVRTATQHILDINHISWEEARHLPIGTEVKLQ